MSAAAAAPATSPYPPPAIRWFITASVMLATLMNALDTTIANVALPHIQGSVAASADEISWVLTSYIVAAAIFTPLSGFLAGRIGRRQLMLWSVAGFTVASGLCGMASNLTEIVGFRFLQGVFGAALVPMSQAILLDINPPEKQGSAMSIWSMGAVMGPIIGPTLGGWLTDNLEWRWVFFVNLPPGLFAFAGVWFFLRGERDVRPVRFDAFGFGTLALAIGSLQLMLDRGQTQDWFGSTEIWIECGSMLLFAYLFVVHSATAKNPFVNLALFSNRNFVVGSIFGFVIGVAIFSVLALLSPMLENLMGYPVTLTGLVTMPRSVGSLMSMTLAGPLMKRVDTRILIATGFALFAWSLRGMTGFSLGMDYSVIVSSGFVQGLGVGLIFVPLSLTTFATLDPRYRNEGAAIFMLVRNIGSAAGISILQAMTVRNAATVHSRLVETVRLDNPVLARAAPGFDPQLPVSVARMNAEITRQAMMVSYIDAYQFLLVLALVAIPLVLFITKPQPRADAMQLHLD